MTRVISVLKLEGEPGLVLLRWILYITNREMLICACYMVFTCVLLMVSLCSYVQTHKMCEANAEVMRNSLPQCPCVRGGRVEVASWGWRVTKK